MIQKTIKKICESLSKKLEKRTITRRDGEPYLERYYIFHSGHLKWLPGIYLHKFLSSDEDNELHNHPWGTSVSLILTGGYDEKRRCKDLLTKKKRFNPGAINVIYNDTFHRVELVEDHAWTLFISGGRQQDWGFWDYKNDYTPWREHIARRENL